MTLYDVNWDQETRALIKESKLFGISMYGDGTAIATTPMINALGSGVNNSFAMLEVYDCTGHMATRGVKDVVYIANLFIPLIAKLENMVDEYVSTLFNLYRLHNRCELTITLLRSTD
jgi:hypothetical protein